MHICFFEDTHYHQFFPLTYFRAVFELRSGIFQLWERIARFIPRTKIAFFVRDHIAPVVQERFPNIPVNSPINDDCLFLNGRWLGEQTLLKEFLKHQKQSLVFTKGDVVVAAFLLASDVAKVQTRNNTYVLSSEYFKGIPTVETDAELAEYPWELLRKNAVLIENDFSFIVQKKKKRISAKVSKNVILLKRNNIIVESGAFLFPSVVLDATKGPIYIDSQVKVLPHAFIEGPCAILNSTLIKSGTQIYEGTTLGPWCKVGGEVEESIFHGYSNKQHSGFVGHSYIGSWVNLGAGTNTSDLKNNYSSVVVTMGSQTIDTGLQFLGLIIGDHSKSSINTMFNTGTIVGVSSSVLGGKFPPKYIPSFTWQNLDGSFVEYDLEKALKVAERVMARRKYPFTEEEQKLFRAVFQETQNERQRQAV